MTTLGRRGGRVAKPPRLWTVEIYQLCGLGLRSGPYKVVVQVQCTDNPLRQVSGRTRLACCLTRGVFDLSPSQLIQLNLGSLRVRAVDQSVALSLALSVTRSGASQGGSVIERETPAQQWHMKIVEDDSSVRCDTFLMDIVCWTLFLIYSSTEIMSAATQRQFVQSLRQLALSGPAKRKVSKHGAGITCARALSTSHSCQAKEYAFEMACSNIRYGPGVTKEIGMDVKNLGGKNVCVMTDPNLSQLQPVKTTLESLDKHGVNYKLFDKCRVEPSDQSLKEAIDFSNKHQFDLFVAVGGGSVMDTCKAANLFSSKPDAEFLDFVNAPIGKGMPVKHTVKPLIAVATTAGTGSETTGTSVFDLKDMKAKTGISSRSLRPTLGILDPLHLLTMPERVAAYSGIDVLCHAIESYTVMPYSNREGQEDPSYRPAYQGNNPISDIWSLHALEVTAKYIKRCVFNPDDAEARCAMLLASCAAGIGFGNAGTHLCHGMSYPISGLVKSYTSEGYTSDHPLVPHGLSVVITAPAVFEFTAPACPERHLRAAEALGYDSRNAKGEDAGKILKDILLEIMDSIGVPDGLKSLGFTEEDIPALVKGTLPQHRVTKLSPRPAGPDELAELLTKSMKTY
ncbi:hypothetical protein RRG08_029084 [Elysia crispata]|uniref:hydroxyacid-oxoacid transhydrogenase n=1 Tax=Elysia crispata TaxID=231223 RepID=A0AAE0ZQ84_9GAST|nr:hypothetical protein RRG08_029084 [Elysia crispata]